MIFISKVDLKPKKIKKDMRYEPICKVLYKIPSFDWRFSREKHRLYQHCDISLGFSSNDRQNSQAFHIGLCR